MYKKTERGALHPDLRRPRDAGDAGLRGLRGGGEQEAGQDGGVDWKSFDRGLSGENKHHATVRELQRNLRGRGACGVEDVSGFKFVSDKLKGDETFVMHMKFLGNVEDEYPFED
jgi:hypothetical protein